MLNRKPAAALLVVLAIWARTAFGATAAASVQGGADASLHIYAWTITNQSSSPIVEVEFPHHHANLFFTPTGWAQDCTNLVAVGFKDASGRCIARSGNGPGIAPGRSAEFKMQIAALGARRATGSVRVRFGNGDETVIGGVEISASEPIGDKAVPLVGLSIVFLIAILARRRKRRLRETAMPSSLAG